MNFDGLHRQYKTNLQHPFYYNSVGNSALNIKGVEGLFYIVVKIKTVKIQNPTSAYLSHLVISFYFCNFHNYFKATVLVTISPLSVMSIMP